MGVTSVTDVRRPSELRETLLNTQSREREDKDNGDAWVPDNWHK